MHADVHACSLVFLHAVALGADHLAHLSGGISYFHVQLARMQGDMKIRCDCPDDAGKASRQSQAGSRPSSSHSRRSPNLGQGMKLEAVAAAYNS